MPTQTKQPAFVYEETPQLAAARAKLGELSGRLIGRAERIQTARDRIDRARRRLVALEVEVTVGKATEADRDAERRVIADAREEIAAADVPGADSALREAISDLEQHIVTLDTESKAVNAERVRPLYAEKVRAFAKALAAAKAAHDDMMPIWRDGVRPTNAYHEWPHPWYRVFDSIDGVNLPMYEEWLACARKHSLLT